MVRLSVQLAWSNALRGPCPVAGEEYLLLRERVVKHLGHLPEPAA
ncbi:hypothetical protein GCM10017687_77530 [Streptomyces echinatus]